MPHPHGHSPVVEELPDVVISVDTYKPPVVAAVLGAGPMADAFFIAFRLPKHFRAILAEGAAFGNRSPRSLKSKS